MTKRFRKLRFLFVYPLVVGLFIVAHTTERNLQLGVLVVLLGETLRLWANGYVGHAKVNWTQKWRGDAKIGQFITAGPYAYIRHPLYLGTFLLGLGFCIIVGSVWLALTALVSYGMIYRRKMRQEEAVLQEEWGETFERYRAAVPRWVPTWRRYSDREGRWSWRGIAASRELKTLVWVIVLIGFLYFREEVAQEHESMWPIHSLKHLVLLVVLVLLMLGDGVFEMVRRWRMRQES